VVFRELLVAKLALPILSLGGRWGNADSAYLW